jgi:hypothetical protein
MDLSPAFIYERLRFLRTHLICLTEWSSEIMEVEDAKKRLAGLK